MRRWQILTSAQCPVHKFVRCGFGCFGGRRVGSSFYCARGAVVEQGELSRQPGRVGGAERGGQLDHCVEQPATNVASDVGGGAVEFGLGDRVGERGATEGRLSDGPKEHVEDSEQPLPRFAMTLDLAVRRARRASCLASR